MTTLFGFEKIYNTSMDDIDVSGADMYLAHRFTAPTTGSASGLVFRAQSNWNGSGIVGLRNDLVGIPEDIDLGSAIWSHASGTAFIIPSVNFNVMPALISGTRYQIVWRPSIAADVGEGSATNFIATRNTNTLGSLFQTRAVGSLFNCVIDNNILVQKSLDAGSSWANYDGSPWRGIAYIINLPGGGADTLNNFGDIMGSTAGANNVGGSGMVGVHYLLDKSYSASGLFTFVASAGANSGSLWARLEYSGALVAGMREEIGSAFITLPATAVVNNTFNFTFPAGSSVFIWLYAPQGKANQGGSRYVVRSNADSVNSTGTYGFGLGSSVTITTANAGSTVTFIPRDDLILFFAKSGATPVADTGYLNSSSDGFTSIIS